MVKVMRMIPQTNEVQEVELAAFNIDSIVEDVETAFSNGLCDGDVEVNSDLTHFVMMTVTSLHGDDGDFDVVYLARKEDYTV